jgi:leader peptidase (prepilin peptidase)/N-methyltransferase
MSSDGMTDLVVTIPFAALVGLFIGSFLNVVVYRTPLGLSVATPRSFCPTCDRQLAWWENIPLVSWLALRGRCHTCHQSISIRYPLVELTTGTVFALVTWAWHGSIISAAYCAIAAATISVALIEYGGQRSPLSIAAIGTWAGQLVIIAGAGWQQHWHTVVSSLVGTALALIAYVILRRVDPEATDTGGHGRSALLLAGCWLGGLGPRPAAVGVAAGVVAYGACLVLARSRVALAPGASPTGEATRPATRPLVAVPLVTAIVVALTASLCFGA